MNVQVNRGLKSLRLPGRRRILVTQTQRKGHVISHTPCILQVQLIVVLRKIPQFRGSLWKNGSSLRIPVEEVCVHLRHRSGEHHCGPREEGQITRVGKSVIAEGVCRISAQCHTESVVHNEIWKRQSAVLAMIPDVPQRASDLKGVSTVRPDGVVFNFMYRNLMPERAAE